MNTKPQQYDIPLTIRVDQEFIDGVEDYRAGRRPVMSKSEVVRIAVAELIKRDKRKAG